MYQDLMKDVNEKFQPMMKMAEINKQAAEKLISLQSSFVTELFNTNLAQVKAFAEVKEPKQVLDLQVKYFKDVEAKMTDVAEKEIAALTEAKEQVTDLIEQSLSDLSEMPNFFDMSKIMPQQEAETEKAAPAPKAAARKPSSAA